MTDGLWSKVRDQFCGLEMPPKPTGNLAYRVTLRINEISDPDVLDLVAMTALNIWIGPGMHAVGYNVRGGELFNMVLLVPDDLPEGVKRQQGNTAELRKLFEGWDPIIDNTEKWKLMHHPPLKSLATKSGRFIMACDSCHPMLPYFAQGANSSSEDAAVLGALMSKVSSVDDLQKIAPIYENLRRERVKRIQAETFIHRDRFYLPDGPEQIQRDKHFALSFNSDSWAHPNIQTWLFSYDAYQDAEKAYESG
ncbi:hypothetical protein BGW36DRAFT_433320 [Talaromyces proteolyticus]|uniref:FAD-binding domain-containing protein n=1 Tax=Talaromyces proteolyticus TaxID=1131652 RepID=A0AAD4PUE6_9EURO|nr:uncharacterized protein BGW36DRAFT_433320 [Talaromyces proteolyticus]KAH8689312.1 hypothetical protein BGW36DRAFT_433320 [Talaromyces proteolyticus]